MNSGQASLARYVAVAIFSAAAWRVSATDAAPCSCAAQDWDLAEDWSQCLMKEGIADPNGVKWRAPARFVCTTASTGERCWPSDACCPEIGGWTGYVLCQSVALGSDPCSLVRVCGLKCCQSLPRLVSVQNSCIGWMQLDCS